MCMDWDQWTTGQNKSPVTQVHLAHTRLVNSGVPRSEIYREPTKFWCIHISKRVLSQVNQIQTESKTRSHDLSVNLQMSQWTDSELLEWKEGQVPLRKDPSTLLKFYTVRMERQFIPYFAKYETWITRLSLPQKTSTVQNISSWLLLTIRVSVIS